MICCKLLVPLLLGAAGLAAQTAPPLTVGPLPGGGYLLNSGWVVKPAGTEVPLDTFPMAATLSKDGKFLLVLNAGYNQPSVTVLDTASMRPVSSVSLPDAWLGMSFTPDGKTLYVGGGSQACVYALSFSAEGQLKLQKTFRVVEESKRHADDFIGDVKPTPDGHLIFAASLYRDAIFVINPQSGRVIETWKTGRRPYRILFDPDGKTFFVTGWADGSLHVHDANTGEKLLRVPLAPHPTDMVWSDRKPEGDAGAAATWKARLFVTAANTNKTLVLTVSDTNDVQVVDTLNVALDAVQPLGMTPSSLVLSPDQSKLYIVCSDANTVAVAELMEGRPRLLGFVPSGWYPTAAAALPDGRLVIVNGRGSRSYPNPKGERAAALEKGSLSVVPPFDTSQMEDYTLQSLRNSPYNKQKLFDVGVPAGNPVPTRPGDPTPIKHVIYIMKDGCAYDQMLGDLQKDGKPLGDGEAKLSAFGETVTPNQHRLAREFVLFDNFYVSGEESLDGQHWSAASIANDYVQKLWRNHAAGRSTRNLFSTPELVNAPPAGYLWTNAAAAGISVRNFGWWATNLSKPAADGRQVSSVLDPILARYTDMNYRGDDAAYADTDRAKVFIEALKAYEKSGELPQLLFVRLSNGGADGTSPSAAAVADNDAALGTIVEAVSKSRFWPQTAIFVVEASAGGADHVDSHRSPVFVLSPYTRRGGLVDNQFYNTGSLLRTIELILGLRPMTDFDAGAGPMWTAFSVTPDATPYTAASTPKAGK